MNLSTQALGMLFAATGVLVLSFDALLVRMAAAGGFEVAFWRGVFIALSLGVVSWLFAGKAAFFKAHKPALIGSGVLFGFTGLFFVLAVMHTAVANVVVILSAAPLFAAFATWGILRERVARHTWFAMLFALVSVLLVFSGSLQGDGLLGDVYALGAAISLGLNFTLLRRYASVPRLQAIALGGVFTALMAWPFAAPLSLGFANYAVLALMGLLQMPLALALLATATRYLPSPEVSLFMLIEMVLAPVWVWLWFAEWPGMATMLAAGILLATLFVHSWVALREQQSGAPP